MTSALKAEAAVMRHRQPTRMTRSRHCAERHARRRAKPLATALMLGDAFDCEDTQLPVFVADFPRREIIRSAVRSLRLL
jgi:hypothetical protein